MIRLWPRSLAARTAVVLLAALIVVQVAGLSIDAMERRDLWRLGEIRDISIRLATLYRRVGDLPPAARTAQVGLIPLSPGSHASIAARAPAAAESRLVLAPEHLDRA
ncbi:MAG: hypothetical protein ACREFV_08945, partial [Acetobacteraceae bacterium]